MTTLNNSMRELILERVMADFKKEEFEQIQQERKVLDQEIFKELFSSNQTVISENKKVKYPFDIYNGHRCNVRMPTGATYETNFDELKSYLGVEKNVYINIPKGFDTCYGAVMKNDELNEKVQALIAKERELNDEHYSVYQKVKTTVYSFRSINKLKEAWPEIEPYLTGLTLTATAVALPINQINAALGLPKVS